MTSSLKLYKYSTSSQLPLLFNNSTTSSVETKLMHNDITIIDNYVIGLSGISQYSVEHCSITKLLWYDQIVPNDFSFLVAAVILLV